MDILASDEADIHNHKIVPFYPLGSNSSLMANFMLKNGKLHMTEVIDFNINNTLAKLKETILKMNSAVETRKNITANVSRHLVFSANANKEVEVVQHLNLTSDYSDRLFNLDSAVDSTAYFNMLPKLIVQPIMN